MPLVPQATGARSWARLQCASMEVMSTYSRSRRGARRKDGAWPLALVVVALVLLGWHEARGWVDVRGPEHPVATSHRAGSGPAPVALDMEGFDPAQIINDEVFYDSGSMSEAEVAAFIARVNAGCQPGRDGTACLGAVRVATTDIGPTTTCPGGYEGRAEESAATVITKVALSCDVNPRVLLVLLQKEQGLLTASGPSLSARDYAAATGYACPDTSACDPAWEGLFLQLYGAASQFQRYRLDPGGYQVVAQVPVQLAYSPAPGCGTSEMVARNQATAGLYNYTPYQPNAAAWSGGNECTSWGNWSFYGFYRAWFGDPAP